MTIWYDWTIFASPFVQFFQSSPSLLILIGFSHTGGAQKRHCVFFNDDDFYLGLLTFLLLGLIRFSFFVSSSKATPRRLSRLKILFEKFQTWGNIVAFSTCPGGIPPSPHYQSPLFRSYSCHLPQLPDYYRQTKVLFKMNSLIKSPKVLTVVCFRLVLSL